MYHITTSYNIKWVILLKMILPKVSLLKHCRSSWKTPAKYIKFLGIKVLFIMIKDIIQKWKFWKLDTVEEFRTIVYSMSRNCLGKVLHWQTECFQNKFFHKGFSKENLTRKWILKIVLWFIFQVQFKCTWNTCIVMFFQYYFSRENLKESGY